MVGVLEAVTFYAAFTTTAWAVAGSWLVFKAASKWATWQHIMKVPEKLGRDEDEYLIFRWAWASRHLDSFVVGTLANMVAAFLGAAIARVLAGLPLRPL